MQAHQEARGTAHHEHDGKAANGTGHRQELAKHQEISRIAHNHVEHNGNDDACEFVDTGIFPQCAVHAQGSKKHERHSCHASDEHGKQVARRRRGQLRIEHLTPRADDPCRGNGHGIHYSKRNCLDDLFCLPRACSHAFSSHPSARRLCPLLYVHPSVACSKSPGRPLF